MHGGQGGTADFRMYRDISGGAGHSVLSMYRLISGCCGHGGIEAFRMYLDQSICGHVTELLFPHVVDCEHTHAGVGFLQELHTPAQLHAGFGFPHALHALSVIFTKDSPIGRLITTPITIPPTKRAKKGNRFFNDISL
jgi:hypothetical protein